MLRYWTAGESHGKTLLALIDGFPAGLEIDCDFINVELGRRQGGYGRGGRQKLETDQCSTCLKIMGKRSGPKIILFDLISSTVFTQAVRPGDWG